ncbi:hypothetical protein HYZ98_03695 [Candidatus Peregrinibacteria bacterium]|nr:hypothetical protein [Candidatus Peregrinibacteria bacterium]
MTNPEVNYSTPSQMDRERILEAIVEGTDIETLAAQFGPLDGDEIVDSLSGASFYYSRTPELMEKVLQRRADRLQSIQQIARDQEFNAAENGKDNGPFRKYTD